MIDNFNRRNNEVIVDNSQMAYPTSLMFSATIKNIKNKSMKTKIILFSILCFGILIGSSSCSKYLNAVPGGILQEDSILLL